MSPSDIATEIGTTLASVQSALKTKLKQESTYVPDEERQGLIDLENARLDHYLSKLWPSIEYGDTKAISAALNITNLRMKINQLDVQTSTQTNNVLVIGGDQQEYIRRLREMNE